MAVTDDALDAVLDKLTDEIRPQARAEAWKAFQRAPHALELDELHSIALTGLAQARARWLAYTEKYGYDPHATQFYMAFCLRRIRGAILDAMRANDWVTRSARTRAKKLRDAGEGHLGEAELIAATGLSAQEIRDTVAAVAARPVSLDAEPQDVADASEDVEGSAVVTSVLEAVAAAISGLDELSRTLLVLHYHEGLPIPAAAASLGVRPEEARAACERGVCAVHDAMLLAVA
jgi:RNA polymerase sigma factor for flagellar operon FliA